VLIRRFRATHGWDRLRVAIEQSLSMGCHDGAAIRHLLTAEQMNRPLIAAIEIGDLGVWQRFGTKWAI
jgi:hypothetical protein